MCHIESLSVGRGLCPIGSLVPIGPVPWVGAVCSGDPMGDSALRVCAMGQRLDALWTPRGGCAPIGSLPWGKGCVPHALQGQLCHCVAGGDSPCSCHAPAPRSPALCCRQPQPAHHPARPQHRHHDLPGLALPTPGWPCQAPAAQRAPAEPAGCWAAHAAPQLTCRRGCRLRGPALHPELLSFPAPWHDQHGLRHLQLLGGAAHDPQHRYGRVGVGCQSITRCRGVPLGLTPLPAPPTTQGSACSSHPMPSHGGRSMRST